MAEALYRKLSVEYESAVCKSEDWLVTLAIGDTQVMSVYSWNEQVFFLSNSHLAQAIL